MIRTPKKIIALLLIIIYLAPQAHAFGFSIFKTAPKNLLHETCALETGLDDIIKHYNETYVSKKIFGFVEENSYQTIALKVKDGPCVHEYRIEITDTMQIMITEGHSDNAGLEITTTSKNIHIAKDAYENIDIIGLIKSSLNLKMPFSARVKTVLFLRSYI